jgi:hypothetical protein
LFPGSAEPEFAPKPLKNRENFTELGPAAIFTRFFPGKPGFGETEIYGEPMPGIA